MPAGLITLLTDFGTADAFVGVMKGVILGIDREAHVVDLTHAVPPQQVLAGALLLRSAVDFFPDGTIHVAVVDPGVGSERQPIVVDTERGFLVGPDNGLLSLAASRMRRRAIWRIEQREFVRYPVSQTFHGRDIFAPAAAHLSRGVDPQRFGPALNTMIELAVPAASRTASRISGEVLYVDHFGNLVTNIDADAIGRFPAHALSVSIAGSRVTGPVSAYTAVAEGAPLAIVGSWGTMEIAVRNGSAAHRFAAGAGTPVTVVVESGDA
jgi:S-adenosylmethionine hydrolase